MIFGKKGCNISRDWKIRIYLATEETDGITICEQLTEKEAKEIYNKLKEKFSDKNRYIEVTDKDEDIFLINKENITAIRVYQY